MRPNLVAIFPQKKWRLKAEYKGGRVVLSILRDEVVVGLRSVAYGDLRALEQAKRWLIVACGAARERVEGE